MKLHLFLPLLACAALGVAWWLGRSEGRGTRSSSISATAEAAQEDEPAPLVASPAGSNLSPAAKAAQDDATEANETARRASAEVAAPQTSFTLRGTIRDERGDPVDGCEVVAEPRRGEDDEPDPEDRQTAPAPGGTFALTELDPGTWLVHAERGDERTDHVPVDVARAGATVELRLVRRVRIAGIVLDPDGKPFSGGRAIANSLVVPGNRSGQGEERRQNCDDDGRFEFRGLAAGPILVQARADDWAPSEEQRLELAPGVERTDLVLRLCHGARLSGVLIDSEGAPLAGKLVELAGASSGRTTSDARGRFGFEGIPPGKYALTRAERNRRGSLLRAEQAAPENRLELTLVDGEAREVVLGGAPAPAPPPPLIVRGTVRLRGAPCPGARIECFEPKRADPETPVSPISAGAWGMLLNPDDWQPSTTQAGDDGCFTLPTSSGGSLVFLVATESGPYTTFAREVPREGKVELDFDLPGAEITGRVLAPDGDVVRHAPLQLEPDDEVPRGNEGSSALEWTDSDGRFALRGLQPGSYVLTAGFEGSDDWSATERRVTIAPEQQLELDLTLIAAARLRGTVRTADGTVFPGAEVVAFGPTPRTCTAVCGSAGSYALGGLTPGRLRVFARTAESCSAWHELDVASGAEPTLDLELAPAARLEVEVVDEHGAPLEAVITIGVPAREGLELVTVHQTSRASRATACLPCGDYGLVVFLADSPQSFEQRDLHLDGPGPEHVRIVLAPQPQPGK